jgi:hypothetical protein
MAVVSQSYLPYHFFNPDLECNTLLFLVWSTRKVMHWQPAVCL